jgi:hypothetical protein
LEMDRRRVHGELVLDAIASMSFDAAARGQSGI